MQDSIQDTLNLICAEQREAGEHVQPPAEPVSIQSLRDYVRDRHGVALADAYADLLSQVDGLDFNGLAIYSTAQRTMPGNGILLGFREVNDSFERGGGAYYVLYGETGDDLVAQEREGVWHLLDKASLSILETFQTGYALFERVLLRAFNT